MKILVINAGSSSIKYQLMDMDGEKVLAKGLCERIGVDGRIAHKMADGSKHEYDVSFPTHKEAFVEVVKMLTEGDTKVVNDVKEIDAIGHRTVMGGVAYNTSVRIDEDVIGKIIELKDLAPLHNPPQAVAIRACQEVFGKDTPMVGVFDTAFHQTMPKEAYIYNIPYEYYEKYDLRRYGFHGTSHRYVSAKLAEEMGKPIEELKIISCHLGNGSSITAVKNGKSVDTSMGFTPLEGFIMGTRCGSIDPSIIKFLMEKENMTIDQVTDVLNKKSGFVGVSGISSDAREIEAAAEKGDERAQLTLDILYYQVKKYIGSYAAAMGGVDAILFTGGIGENADLLREAVCSNMEFMGLEICPEKNKSASRKEAKFSTDTSKVQAWVIPTDEELLIARDTKMIIEG